MSMRDFRRFMKAFLNSHKFHVSVIVLVIVDCFVLTAELIIDHLNDALKDPNFSNDKKDSSMSHNLTDHSHSSQDSHNSHEKSSGFGSYGPLFHVLEEVFKYTSLTILSIFVVEIILKLIFIPKIFTKPLEIFDALVVIVSFALNLYLFNKKHHIHSFTGLITMMRLWRFTEIINGVVLTIESKHEHKIRDLKQRIEKLEAENAALKNMQQLSDNDNYTEYDNLRPKLEDDGV